MAASVELGQPFIEGAAADVYMDAALYKIPGEGATEHHQDHACNAEHDFHCASARRVLLALPGPGG
jgi:hypothetical protein